MKFTKIFIIGAALISGCAVCPAQTNLAAPGTVALSPEQAAKLDSSVNAVLQLLPAQYHGTVASAITLIGLLAIAGRAFVGWRRAGFFGLLGGLFGGTNHPDNLTAQPATYGAGSISKGASQLLKVVLLLGLPALLLTAGCDSIRPHQVVNFSKGTGANLNLPIGFNGANFAEINLKIGQFYTATAVQPVSTNAAFVPAVAFASSTDGGVIAPQVGSGTNLATITGGDKFTGSIGTGTGSISNLVGTTTSTGAK